MSDQVGTAPAGRGMDVGTLLRMAASSRRPSTTRLAREALLALRRVERAVAYDRAHHALTCELQPVTEADA